MPQFVKEGQISDLAPGADCLVELADVFKRSAQRLARDGTSNDELRPVYTIRGVDTVYKVFTPELLARYFREADAVEKVTFQFETGLSKRTNRRQGEYLELNLEETDPRKCYLAIGASDEHWVDDSYNAVQDVLARCRRQSGQARAAWQRVALDLCGAGLGLAAASWVATLVSPMLPAANAYWLSFFFTLLVFMTTWMIAEPQRLLRSIRFPNMRFRRDARGPLPRLVQAVSTGRGLLS